ncbi:hypothetical protein Tco_1490377 [Tanacetum coccineum]
MDINKMTDTLEPEETGVGGLQLPGKDRVVFRPSERITISVIHFQFHLRTTKVSSMVASIHEDVEKASLADQDDVGIGRVTPSSRSSRSSDHRRSRHHSPEYDRREGRAVSRRYIVDKDSEPSSRQGRDNRDYDIKRSRYETSRRTPADVDLEALVQMGS